MCINPLLDEFENFGHWAMDTEADFDNVNNDSTNKPEKVELELNGGTEEDIEKQSLLPSRRGGLSKKSGKPRLKVQWNDKNGNKLAEVVEFEPSDDSDSDDEESDSCICAIM